MSGTPAAAMMVGTMPPSAVMPFRTRPAGILPGQRRTSGARKPPSQPRPFSPRNGVVPPSGQVNFSAPLSVGKHHDGVAGDAQLIQLGQQLPHHPVQLLHPVGVYAQPGLLPPDVP